jgi:hypothetical protein
MLTNGAKLKFEKVLHEANNFIMNKKQRFYL